ncbi:transcription initiation factor TFIID subunit 8 [Desmophyllum pertusum]|uniref:Transcription initiation factor TFIID subunit 8 n=1 Tax=Desmophyllum pertusum TaxID=174260 RepID=A0A9W9YW76_9CNID|nr:transcription initiation factor TFIID subunit 8 [Desmophyllum pertusum]
MAWLLPKTAKCLLKNTNIALQVRNRKDSGFRTTSLTTITQTDKKCVQTASPITSRPSTMAIVCPSIGYKETALELILHCKTSWNIMYPTKTKKTVGMDFECETVINTNGCPPNLNVVTDDVIECDSAESSPAKDTDLNTKCIVFHLTVTQGDYGMLCWRYHDLSELGHNCKLSCELSARVKPTLSDVKVALIDMGADLDSLPSYGKRANRVQVNNPLKSRIAPTPKSLAAGTRQTRPAHIPAHLPPLPDPHSYIKTPAFRQSSKEYQAVREKYAAQRKDIEEGLSNEGQQNLVLRICEGLDAPTFPLLVNDSNDLSYLSAVGDFDETDLQEQDESSSNSVLPASSTDSFDNPYFRPAKRSRKVLKPS